MRETFHMFEQKVDLGLGTQVRNVCDQMKEALMRIQQVEHVTAEAAGKARSEEQCDSVENIDQILRAKIEALSEDFVDIEAYKQGLEHTLNSMSVLSDRIEATEGLLKELKATAYEQCRPKLPVGISGSKLSDALSGELSATNSTRDHAFSASLTTEPSSSSSRPSTPSGSRVSPRSDVGEEQSPKPPSTVGSEAKMGDSVEKEPEAHCGESEAVPSVVEGIEGTKGEAHFGESEAVASAVEGIEGRKGEAVEE